MRARIAAVLVFAAAAGASAWLLRAPGVPDFEREVAPLLGARCASCHRPEGGAPFALLRYEDVRARAAQIDEVVRRRIMPPWMPERGEHALRDDRSLDEAGIDLLSRWVSAGAPGRPGTAVPLPAEDSVRPDLVVEVPEAYALVADGPDLYRNFVAPIPLEAARVVRGWRFRPGAPGAVHHAFLFFDRTGEAARLDALDPAPGFPGLHVPRGAASPPGHFMSWQPGASLVIQAHLKPTGRVESVRPAVEFFFGPRAAERQPLKIGLWSDSIDIPAGAAEHIVRDTFTLPVDVDVLGLLPHAHYLARRVEVRAARPDGTSTTLLRIPRWNFDWQGDYAFRDPVPLPRGTVLSMEIAYDNTEGNARNPHRPPKRVTYGLGSADEMAELWLRVLPREPGGAAKIEEALVPKVLASSVAYNRRLIEADASNARAHLELGRALVMQRRPAEAMGPLAEASRLRPEDDEAAYFRGLSFRMQGQLGEALGCFREAMRLNPSNAKAHGNAGLVLMERGEFDAAAAAFREALRLNPADDLARRCLDDIDAARGRRK